jgi:hypothetical protein
MKIKCPGYRDFSELIFRDETARTREKSRRLQSANNVKVPVTEVTEAATLMSSACIASACPSLTSMENIAIYQFYHTIMENLTDKDPTRYLHAQLPSLYAKSKPGSALRLATQAISFAAFSRLGHKATLLARKRYVEAIRSTKRALQDPCELRSDETLYAILLLSGYEVGYSGKTNSDPLADTKFNIYTDHHSRIKNTPLVGSSCGWSCGSCPTSCKQENELATISQLV